MAKHRVFVKKLDVIETLGSVSLIATDKTGTLTMNKMEVSDAWFPNGVTVTASDFCKDKKWRNTVNRSQLENFVRIVALNSRVIPDYSEIPLSPIRTEEEEKPTDQPALLGDATECGIYLFADRVVNLVYNQNIEQYRSANRKLFEIPFNSTNKWQFSIHSTTPIPATPSSIFATTNSEIGLIKGAPDIVAQVIATYLGPEGPRPADDDFRTALEGAAYSFASEGKRVLGLACADMKVPYSKLRKSTDLTGVIQTAITTYLSDFESPHQKDSSRDSPPLLQLITGTGFCFLGLICLHDPPRPKAKAAVKECHDAGIQVVMITGDHPITAAAIALQIGIISCMPRGGAASLDSLAAMARERRATGGDATLAAPPGADTNTDVEAGSSPIEAPLIIPGSILKDMTPQHWSVVTKNRQVVFARTTPEDKLLVVKQFAGESGSRKIIGMTGDGVNDAPALKEAAIGIAMGTGSDVWYPAHIHFQYQAY